MKKNDATKALILEQLRKTPIVEAACHKIGISRMSFYRWKDEDKQFAQDVDQAILDGRSLVNDIAEGQLINAVQDRNLGAVQYWLRHHHKDYKAKVEIEGAVNAIHELSPEQAALMRRAFELAGIDMKDHDHEETIEEN